ncbi:coiled-coil domain-containing protein 17 [Denticeps clupeoides]|uniref:coiled-coil domain-containing protein 17 n=1 Tax=Denticeps clupeoides TaxID=299321 RepID=UPI0010A485B7|nr:coiled-coil domain-containing protein 17 [Denticeps clupeoides]
MEKPGEFTCRDCHMAFHTAVLLDKHRARFCLGSDMGDPVVLRQGRVEYRAPETGTMRGAQPETRTRTSELVRIRERTTDRGHPDDECPLPQRDSGPQVKVPDSFTQKKLSRQDTPVVPELLRPPQSEKVRLISEQYERQLAQIRAHNHQLQQQKEEIEQCLAALTGLGGPTQLETLLHELREQEERNGGALQQISSLVHAMQTHQGAKEADDPRNSPKDRRMQNVAFDQISSVVSPLSTQIRSLGVAYTQSGGKDPAVLAQMHSLEAEANLLEQSRSSAERRTRQNRSKHQGWTMDTRLMALEKDNQHLKEKIGERSHTEELQLNQQLAKLLVEIGFLRREVEWGREGSRGIPLQPPATFPGTRLDGLLAPISQDQFNVPDTSVPERKSLDTLGPAPYDPVAGFIIFYDMILGVDASLTQLCLVTGLYSIGQEMCRSTALRPVQCQPAGALPYSYSLPQGNYAIVSAKQPAPRIQPSPSLSLVVEVHAGGGLGSCSQCGQDVQQTVPQGWACLELFDQYNQIRSGFWRVPFRVPPVRPLLTVPELNSVPQLGNTELCLRVVNSRDGDTQNFAKIGPRNAGHYKYPTVDSHNQAHLTEPPTLTPLQFPEFSNSDPPPAERPQEKQ